jgi:ABC-type antimicrobial peptide transport system permease subunit
MPPVVLPITLLLALAVALLGSALPVRQAVRFEPVLLLRGK